MDLNSILGIFCIKYESWIPNIHDGSEKAEFTSYVGSEHSEVQAVVFPFADQ